MARRVDKVDVTRRLQNGIQGTLGTCPWCGQETNTSRKKCMRCKAKLKTESKGKDK